MDGLYAFDIVRGSVEKTKELLFKPFNFKVWLKLALIALLINGGISAGSNTRFRAFDTGDVNFLSQNMPLVLVSLVLLLLIIIFFSYLGSCAVFVFLESAVYKKVELIDGLERNLKNGLTLLLFDLLLFLAALFVLLALLLPGILVYASLSGVLKYVVLFAYGLLALTILILALTVFSLTSLLTKDFVVPIMFRKKEGLIGSWKRLWDIINKNKGQFLGYVIARIILGLVTGVIALVIVIILIIIVFLIALIVGLFAAAAHLITLSTLSTISVDSLLKSPPVLVIASLVMLFALIAFAYVAALTTLPIPVFYRYYSLLFLAKINPEMDLLTGKEDDKKQEKKEGEPKEDIYVEVDK